MNGQWLGEYVGTGSGRLMINVDDRVSHFEGVVYLRPHDKYVPQTGAGFQTVNKDREFRFDTRNFWAIHPRTGYPASWDEIKQFYPAEFKLSGQADVTGEWDE